MRNISSPELMKIGIDGFNLALNKGTGIATYARTLSYALKSIGCSVDILYGMDISPAVSSTLQEIMFFDSLTKDTDRVHQPSKVIAWLKNRVNVHIDKHAHKINMTGRVDARSFIERMPAYDRILNIQNLFSYAHRHFRRTGRFLEIIVPDAPRVMHWTYPLPIQVENSINLYTIHDVVPLRLPYTTLDNKGYYINIIEKICNLQHPVCTVSEASKKDILSFFPQLENHIYNPFQSCMLDRTVSQKNFIQTEQEIKGMFGLKPEEYFLFYGSLEPKKNIGRIIESFLTSATHRKLVIVGAMSWRSDSELRFLKHGISQGRIILIDYLPQSILYALIRHARALLFPSLSEGFGLPVLEAMSMRTPVLTSREGGLPEVVGENAVIVDAYDIFSITDGISRIDQDDDLYKKLSMDGQKQAENFSMTAYQNRLRNMYSEIIADRKS